MADNPLIPSPTLCHDLRNALTPAMISADILTGHDDPQIRHHAAIILHALEKALDKLTLTQQPQVSR